MASSGIPQDVANILDTLKDGDKQTILDYMASLRPKTEDAEKSAEPDITAEAEPDIAAEANDEGDSDEYTPAYFDPTSGSEDYDAATNFKQQAADAKSSGDWPAALEFYNQAVTAAPPSALLYANRAMALTSEGHYKAAETDCRMALELNPDSAKALKVRGKLRHEHLDDWQGALSDLSQAQSIDFDPDVADTLKELSKLRVEEERKEAKGRNDKEEKLKKRAEEIKKAQEQAKEDEMRAAREAVPDVDTTGGMPDMAGMGGMPDMAGMGDMGGMPGGMGGMPGGMGGMPGGMGGMPGGMGGIMEMFKNDPEMAEAMKNPKVVAAFSELMSGPGGPMGLMSNPGKMAQLMNDPDVGPLLQKIMSKMMGGMGAGGMPGMPGQQPGFGANDDTHDDVPDLGDVPELD